jgi:pimeloyl-ACP methyl ester carboxylesterase
MFPEDAIHNTCDTNGLRTHYIEAGSGEPLVLLHGFLKLPTHGVR